MKTQTGVIAGLAAGAGYLAWRLMRPRPPIDLRAKVVLITGGSRGLGLQLAREFGSQGARIVICARDPEELERAQRDLRNRNIEAHIFVCDVSDRHKVQAMVDEISRQVGPINVLVNNAGLIKVGPLSAMSIDDFEEAMDVMFWGSLYAALAVLPSMRERRQGSIVNITSIGGKVSVPHLLPYTCAKFAAVALSEGLRAELAPAGIRVTTIVPGLMRTGSHLHAKFKGKHALEYGWFAAGAATPAISIDAERAAREIVDATVHGASEKILSMPANVLAHAHAALPQLSGMVLELVNRLLPSSEGKNNARPGHEMEARWKSRIWETITSSGRQAAESLNELNAH